MNVCTQPATDDSDRFRAAEFEHRGDGGLLEVVVAGHRDGVLRLTLRGQIDCSIVAELGDKLAAALIDGGHRVELDMAEITYCGAAGLRVLTDTRRRCVEHDGSMRIVAPSRLVARLLEVTGLDNQLLVGAHRSPAAA